MRPVRWGIAVVVAIGLAVILMPPAVGHASGNLSSITGIVRDSTGTPIIGALVVVVASNPAIPERMSFTDKWGGFTVPNLFAGEYAVKVTMPRFLPALKNGIQIRAGNNTALTVNLQNAFDVVRRVVSGEKAQSDDILWTLRSSRSTQPVLKLAQSVPDNTKTAPLSDYSGYLQVYSKTVETSSGVEEGVGSQFAVTMPLDAKSRFTFAGQYNDQPTQPRGFGANYQFTPTDRHRTDLGINVRQGSLVGDPVNGELKEIQLQYGENFQWTDHIVINYGAEAGRVGTLSDRNYLRPRFAVSWVPQARTTITAGATSQAPNSGNDPIRGKEYFDRAAYIPPALERYAHTEVMLSRVVSENMDASAAVFKDQTDTQALFTNSGDGRRGVLFLDSSNSPSEGLRLHLNRNFKYFQGGLGYTTTTGLAVSNHTSARFPHEVQNALTRERFHLVTARFHADIDLTQTEVTAVYRWVSGFSATRLDPYQKAVDFNDPSLSLTVAQDLPSFRMIPGKVQAILDARNVLEYAYTSKSMQISQYPRLFKGGINIKF